MLRYGVGQQYKRHMDSLQDDLAGPRVCTVLMYLNGGLTGGVHGAKGALKHCSLRSALLTTMAGCCVLQQGLSPAQRRRSLLSHSAQQGSWWVRLTASVRHEHERAHCSSCWLPTAASYYQRAYCSKQIGLNQRAHFADVSLLLQTSLRVVRQPSLTATFG